MVSFDRFVTLPLSSASPRNGNIQAKSILPSNPAAGGPIPFVTITEAEIYDGVIVGQYADGNEVFE
jgi:hypothetical protein